MEMRHADAIKLAEELIRISFDQIFEAVKVEFEGVELEKVEYRIVRLSNSGKYASYNPETKNITFNVYNIGGKIQRDVNNFGVTVDESIKYLLEAIAHEICHAFQHVRDGGFDNTLPYLERPHEVEAYALQRVVIDKLLN